jgi:cobalt/nickel transport system permease protein
MAKKDFIERSIRGALSFFKESIFADEIASRPGLLQSLDPRVKAVTVLLFILLVMFTRSLAILGIIYLLCLILALISRIGLGFFLKRTWIFIPFFSLLIAIPALFSFVSPGEPIGSAGPFVITRPGLMTAGIFLGRVVTSVSLAVLLSMTTRHFELLKALRFFGIPQMFVMVLGITYRYIYLFVEIVEDTFRAIRSRVGSGMHYRKGQKVVAWNIAHLWIRSYALNEQVYLAMVSRGFRGEPRTLDHFQTRQRDWLWLFVVAMVIVLLACTEYLIRA